MSTYDFMKQKLTRKIQGMCKQGAAALTLTAFIFTNALFPPAAHASEIFGMLRPGLDAKILDENPFGLHVPEDHGEIDSFYQSRGNSPLVVFIQDAHANISAQKNAAKIIGALMPENLSSKQGDGKIAPVTYVLTEGAAGYVSGLPLKAFIDAGMDARELLLRKGVINGPELGMLDQPKLVVWGLEDSALYQSNLAAWSEAQKTSAACRQFIELFREETGRLLWEQSPKELKELLKAEDAMAGEKADLAEAGKILKSFIRILRRELAKKNARKPLNAVELRLKYPHVFRLLQVTELWEIARGELEKYREDAATRAVLRTSQSLLPRKGEERMKRQPVGDAASAGRVTDPPLPGDRDRDVRSADGVTSSSPSSEDKDSHVRSTDGVVSFTPLPPVSSPHGSSGEPSSKSKGMDSRFRGNDKRKSAGIAPAIQSFLPPASLKTEAFMAKFEVVNEFTEHLSLR